MSPQEITQISLNGLNICVLIAHIIDLLQSPTYSSQFLTEAVEEYFIRDSCIITFESFTIKS